jgi:hypothetical protein
VCNKEGDNPSSSIRRSTIVHFVCGTYNTIINVTESQVKIERWIEQSSDPYMMNMHHSIVHCIFPSLSSSSSSLTTSVMIVLLTESTHSYAPTPSHSAPTYSTRLDRHADTIWRWALRWCVHLLWRRLLWRPWTTCGCSDSAEALAIHHLAMILYMT